jgi:hypothetical protein
MRYKMDMVSLKDMDHDDSLSIRKGRAKWETIQGFEEKGWALYEVKTPVTNLDTLKQMVEHNYEGCNLKDGRRYMPLPLVKGFENDYDKVMDAFLALNNPPCFVDIDEQSLPEQLRPMKMRDVAKLGIFPKTKGVYPIDSVEFNGDLALIVDKRNVAPQSRRNIPKNMTEPAIIIHYEEIGQALDEQVNQYRIRKEFRVGDYTVH